MSNHSYPCFVCGRTLTSDADEPSGNCHRHPFADLPGRRFATATLSATAIDQATQIINDADSLLITGLNVLDLDGQAAAWKLADRAAATLDVSCSNVGRGKMLSMQRLGKNTATFGQTKRRADLIIFWFCDPVRTSPCLVDLMLRTELSGRRLIAVSDQANRSTEIADLTIQLDRSDAVELITRLRLMSRSTEQNENVAVSKASDVSKPQQAADTLHELIEDAQHVAICLPTTPYWKSSEQDHAEFDVETESIMRFAQQLNRRLPCVVHSLDRLNGAGAQYVMAALGGYPMATDFHRGFGRFHANEYSAKRILDNRACDAVMLFTSMSAIDNLQDASAAINKQSTDHLSLGLDISEQTQKFLERISVIEIGVGKLPFADVAIEAIACSTTGRSLKMRSDGVLLQAELSTQTMVTVKQVLDSLASKINLEPAASR